MEHFKNFITMFYCGAAILLGLVPLFILIFQNHNYIQALFMVLPYIAAYPTLIKWFKDAFQREHGKNDKKQ